MYASAVDAPIRYAKSGDVNVAYQVTGGGPFDLVLVSGFISHLSLDWAHPASASFLERLGSFRVSSASTSAAPGSPIDPAAAFQI